jgi:hypothetical protein
LRFQGPPAWRFPVGASSGDCGESPISGSRLNFLRGASDKTIMKRKRFLGLALALLAPLAVAAGADAKPPVRSSVTIDAHPQGLFGQVKSPRDGCSRKRTVTVFKALKGRPDRRIGTSRLHRSGGRGVWSVRTKATGSFYAGVAARGRCQKDVSPRAKALPRGGEDAPNCPVKQGFCQFRQIHLDIPAGTYCPSFTHQQSDCSGVVREGLIPWCCRERDSIRWQPFADGKRRFVLFQSFSERGGGKRWELSGYLDGPGDGALKSAQTETYVGVDFKGSTPDAAGAPAGTMGGPLHFDFQSGFWGADVYVDGYFYRW